MTILTEAERRAAAYAAGPFTADQWRAIEAAVLAKLAAQEPVINYAVIDEYVRDKGVNYNEVCRMVRAAVAAPQPAVVQVPQGTHYPDMGSQEVPSIGSEWSHSNGDTYTVTGYADMFSENHQKRPPRVIYRSTKTGRVWSRELSDWHRAMTFKAAAPEATAQEKSNG